VDFLIAVFGWYFNIAGSLPHECFLLLASFVFGNAAMGSSV
jgi:hypothetical protein